MMDILTVLVLFLLFHSFNGEMPEQRIELPDSVVDTRPRGTLAIVVNPEAVLVQGTPWSKLPNCLRTGSGRLFR